MDDRTALLNAIRDKKNRTEDLPRLAFADLLDEEGKSAWAAFIRMQCRDHRLRGPISDVRCKQVCNDRGNYDSPVDLAFMEMMPPHDDPVIVKASRGFVTEWQGSYEDWEDHSVQLLYDHPTLEHVVWTTRPVAPTPSIEEQDRGLNLYLRGTVTWMRRSQLDEPGVEVRRIEQSRRFSCERRVNKRDVNRPMRANLLGHARSEITRHLTDVCSLAAMVEEWQQVEHWHLGNSATLSMDQWRHLDESVVEAARERLRRLDLLTTIQWETHRDPPPLLGTGILRRSLTPYVPRPMGIIHGTTE